MGTPVKTVLDTSVLIEDPIDRIDGDLAISAISLAELHFGLLSTSDGIQRAHRLHRLIAVERWFEPLPVDAVVARSYGQLSAAARAAGRQPRGRALDLMIAATAHAHGARLLTRNPDDFRGVEHLVPIIVP